MRLESKITENKRSAPHSHISLSPLLLAGVPSLTVSSPHRPAPRSDGATEAGRATSRAGSPGNSRARHCLGTLREREREQVRQAEGEGGDRDQSSGEVRGPSTLGRGRVKGYTGGEGSPQSADYVKIYVELSLTERRLSPLPVRRKD